MYLRAVLLLLFSCASGIPSRNFNNNLDGRIVGGQSIPIEKVPYQISLQVDGKHRCGGSIIAPNYIITAAHCTFREKKDKLSVRAGTSTRETGGQVINVKEINNHPNFNSKTVDYDFAILELVSSLKLGLTVAVIALPSQDQTWPAGTEVLVSGWGYTSENSTKTPVDLQGVNVELFDDETCQKVFDFSIRKFTDRMFCAGVNGGGKHVSHRDSGGPLQVDGILAGVVSMGSRCRHSGCPDIYTKVSAVLNFVQNITSLPVTKNMKEKMF